MKLFGEFLAEAGLIKEHDLLEAILLQLSQGPDVPKVLRDQKFLSDAKLLQAFKFQHKHGGDFRQACRALGFWSKAMQDSIDREARRIRTPIGQILVERGVLTETQLSQALQDYFSSRPLSALPEPASALDEDGKRVIRYALSEGRIQRIEVCLAKVDADPDIPEDDAQILYSELNILLGAATLSAQWMLESLVGGAQQLIDWVLRESMDRTARVAKIQPAVQLTRAALDLGLHLRGGGLESDWWKKNQGRIEAKIKIAKEAA